MLTIYDVTLFLERIIWIGRVSTVVTEALSWHCGPNTAPTGGLWPGLVSSIICSIVPRLSQPTSVACDISNDHIAPDHCGCVYGGLPPTDPRSQGAHFSHM